VTLLVIGIFVPVIFTVGLGFTSWPMFFMGYAAFHIVGLSASRLAIHPEGRRWRRTVGEQQLAAEWAARAERGEG